MPHPSKNRASRTAILHLSPDLDPGERGRETVDLAVLTQRSGWRALIASAGGRLINEGERAAVRHRRMPLDGRGLFCDWRNRMRLESLIQKERPALLHAHGIEPVPYAYAAARIHRLPLIIDLTQPLADTPRVHKLFESLRTVPFVIRVPSAFMAQHLRDVFKLDEACLRHVPPGIDLLTHGAGFISPDRLQNLSRLWRLPEQASVVLVPMPLEPGMGHKIFLQAMEQLKNDHIYAVLAGSGRDDIALRVEIEELIEKSGLSGKVIMPDYCADLPAACWLASVVVAPNELPRGQNKDILAAQAIGRPVIVTDTGANREMVLSGETAWVVPPGDVAALSKALGEAVRLDTGQRLGLAECTHDFIASTFPQDAWFNEMLELYKSMLLPTETSARAIAA